MYSFRDTQPITRSNKPLLSEAMKVGNDYIENLVDGYQTARVSGRELLGYSIEAAEIHGRDGTSFLTANYPDRSIRVDYVLKADNSAQFRKKFNELNKLLSQKQMTFSFADEPDYEWTGTLSTNTEFPPGTNVGVGSFEIYCNDPFKYKRSQTATGTGTVRVPGEANGDVPVRITLNRASGRDRYTITNSSNDLKIEIVNASNTSGDIHIYPKRSNVVRNSVDRPELLAWTTDLENFTVQAGDTLRVAPSNSITVETRERLI